MVLFLGCKSYCFAFDKIQGKVMTKKTKLNKLDEQYVKEMMEMYGLTRQQAIKQLETVKAHGF